MVLHLKDNIKLIRAVYVETQAEFVKHFTGITVPMQKSYEAGKAEPGLLYLEELSLLTGIAEKEIRNKKLSKGDIKVEKAKEEEILIQGEIDKIFGEHEERLLRIEAHLEVFQDAIAGLQAENKNDFSKKVGALRQEVQAAVNRRFDELKKKSSGL